MVIVIGIEGVFTWHHLLCPYAEGILLSRLWFHASSLTCTTTVSTEIQKAFPKHVWKKRRLSDDDQYSKKNHCKKKILSLFVEYKNHIMALSMKQKLLRMIKRVDPDQVDHLIIAEC